MSVKVDLSKYIQAVKSTGAFRIYGRVKRVVGLVVQATGLSASVGELCRVIPSSGNPIDAEVVGFKDEELSLMPYGELRGIKSGDKVELSNSALTIKVGTALLGRVLDALGTPIDGKGDLICQEEHPIHGTPPNPVLRKRISEPIATGIRAIDGLLTIGKGQRVGIFAGSGVGKSTLLGMIARHTSADVNVIALIGERGREVREFIERELGEDGLKRSVVVVATSDQPPLLRVLGALTATAIAEFFRDRGLSVMLMMDSLTRFAMAQREIGLAAGEPPTTKGYTPSVFTRMPALLERAGTSPGEGSITGIYTVLVEGDDLSDPVADAARAILDGHIVLSRQLADQNHYPAIDVLKSISRVMNDVVSDQHREMAARFRGVLATYWEFRDLINIGAYQHGSNPRIDYAIQHIDAMNEFLKQDVEEKSDLQTTLTRLTELFES
jgi:flagellum-specific ATP synthase